MFVSQRVSCQVLCFGLVVALSACSSVTPSVDPSQSLDPAACLKVDVQGPDTVAEGEGFAARVTTTNVCAGEIRVPVADATAISEGRDTGVEISFHIMVTDPEIKTGTVSQGYLVRWTSVEPHPNYVRTQTMVTLEPGGELVRKLSWDGLDGGSKVLPDGNYVLFGEFFYTPNGIDAKDFNVILGQHPFEVVSQ